MLCIVMIKYHGALHMPLSTVVPSFFHALRALPVPLTVLSRSSQFIDGDLLYDS